MNESKRSKRNVSPFVSYAQNFEDVLLWRALRDVEDGFYIDIGAHSPTIDSVTAAFYGRGWHGINIEPVAEWFDGLVAARPRDLNLKVCAGERRGQAVLNVIPATGLSTLKSDIVRDHRNRGFPVVEQTVEIVSLADVCRQHVSGPIHFLKIDVEGAERDVLLGADFDQYRPWIVVVEATAPLSRRTTQHTWESLLLQARYRCVWFDGLNRFYVAEERAELGGILQCPPNVFDGFKLSPDHPFVLKRRQRTRRAAKASS